MGAALPQLTGWTVLHPAVRRVAMVLVVAGSALLVAGCGTGPSNAVLGDTFTSPECLVPPEAEQYAARVLELVNQERANQALPPLTTNAVLSDLAADYACELIEGEFFEHVSPVTGSTVGSRALQGGYFFKKVGENLAGGQTTPEKVMSDWMASPSHRANILDEDFIEIGATVRTGGEYGWYWVQEFGLPR